MRRALVTVPPAAGVAYAVVVRPRILRWGATDAEVVATLPGDEIVEAPRTRSTRAIRIAADAADVWPWLVQLGQDRGGFYSYDRLENLFGYDIHTTDRIVPAWQHLAVGDRVRLGPADAKVDVAMDVALAEPGRALVLRAPGTPQDAFASGMGFPSWAFVIAPCGSGGVRLIARWRCDFAPSARGFLLWKYGVEPVHFLMERQMLKTIKRLAERLHVERLSRGPTP